MFGGETVSHFFFFSICGFALFPTALPIAFAAETLIAQWVLFHSSGDVEFSDIHIHIHFVSQNGHKWDNFGQTKSVALLMLIS